MIQTKRMAAMLLAILMLLGCSVALATEEAPEERLWIRRIFDSAGNPVPTEIEDRVPLDYQELTFNPDDYEGLPYAMEGTILNIDMEAVAGRPELIILVDGYDDLPALCRLKLEEEVSLRVGDSVYVEGIIEGARAHALSSGEAMIAMPNLLVEKLEVLK